METPNYRLIEERFGQLMSLLDGILSPEELAEVRDFIEVGEYGVAVETLIAILVEEDKVISRQAFDLIQELASAMGIDDEPDLERIQVVPQPGTASGRLD